MDKKSLIRLISMTSVRKKFKMRWMAVKSKSRKLCQWKKK